MQVKPPLSFHYVTFLLSLHELVEITSSVTQSLLQQMKKEMQDGFGVGVAAPQLGVSKQLFSMQCAEFSLPFTTLFNPKWEPVGKERYECWEACLSVPGLWGPVSRFNKVRV